MKTNKLQKQQPYLDPRSAVNLYKEEKVYILTFPLNNVNTTIIGKRKGKTIKTVNNLYQNLISTTNTK